MCDFIKYAGGVIFGAAVGCGFGLVSFWLQRLWMVRDSFHTTVAEQIAKLDEIDRLAAPAKPFQTAEMEDLFATDSVPVLVAAARRVKRHIRPSEQTGLDTRLADYKDYQAKNKGMTARCLIAKAGDKTFSEAVRYHLEKIDESVTSNPVAFCSKKRLLTANSVRNGTNEVIHAQPDKSNGSK